MLKDRLKNLETIFQKFFKNNQNFQSSTLVDSDQVVEYTLEVGAEVYVSSTTGSELASDAEYTLSNGVSFTVEDGKIKEILSQGEFENVEEEDNKEEELSTDEEEVEETKEEEELADEEDEQVNIDIDEVIEEIADEEKEEEFDEVANLKDEIEKLKQIIEDLKNQSFSKSDLETFKKELFGELKNTPAPVAKVETSNVSADKDWLAIARMNKK